MSTTNYLQAVRQKLTNPQNWTQGAMARDSDKMSVAELSPAAVCWCLLGAMIACNRQNGLSSASTNDNITAGSNIISQLAFKRSHSSISVFNDTSTHAQVLSLLDEAIEISNQ